MTILDIRGLTKRFAGLTALNGLDLQVEEGELLGAIGPNGAGKTTLFNVICGTHRPNEGTITFRGEDITGLKTHKVAARGIVRAFQLPNVFQEFTVLESMSLASHLSAGIGFWNDLVGGSSNDRRQHEIDERSMGILERVGMTHFANKPAGELSYGYRKTMGVGMALGADPSVLLLDEPLAGLNPERSASMVRLIEEIHAAGTTVIIVEHNMRAMMGLCRQIVVLNAGRKIAYGPPEQIRQDKAVIEAYLGGGKHAA